MKRLIHILPILLCMALPLTANSQTHRAVWDVTGDFETGGELHNVNARVVLNQLQLDPSRIETPYLWISNTGSNEVAQLSSEDGRVLRTIELEDEDGNPATDPSRTAVDKNFNCWVGYRGGHAVGLLDAEGAAHHLFTETSFTGVTDAWALPRAVAINADGNVWIGNWDTYSMRLIEPETGELFNLAERPPRLFNPGTDNETTTQVPVIGGGSTYGFSMDAYGNLWVSQRENQVGQYDAITGEHIMTYSFEHLFGVDFYGIAVDLDGNVWLGNGRTNGVVYLPATEVERCNEVETDGSCNVLATPVDGDRRDYVQVINPTHNLDNDGNPLDDNGICEITRGVAVDQSGNVWVNCYGDSSTNWDCNGDLGDNSVMHVDGSTLDVIGVYDVGEGPLGLTATADGSVWTVNRCGDAPLRPFGEIQGWRDMRWEYDCPNGSQTSCETSQHCPDGEVCVGAEPGFPGQCRHNPANGGTITRMRGSDGKVIATYPTCGYFPYTYSDLAGYNLRSVALRSGWWHNIHDSAETGLDWEQLDWNTSMPQNTEIRIRLAASDNADDPALSEPSEEIILVSPDNTICIGDIEPCTVVADIEKNGIDISVLGLSGRYLGIEIFLLTRNDYRGPVVEDITVASQCVESLEECNGYDDDCNDEVDDDIAPWGECETGLPGECNNGHFICANGQGACVRSVDPVDEECNELDDNCNGRVDEGVTNACGNCDEVPDEVCDGVDNNCNGLKDEGVQRTCLNFDTCATFATCDDCDDPPVELCDGVDNNCNGLIDEGRARVCTDFSEGNLCGTIQVCDELCPDPPGERCNRRDDNCNGLVDEGAQNTCITFSNCTTYLTCDSCDATPDEVCDGIDNNCNGEVDEGVANACGTCGPEPAEECDGIDNNCNAQVDEGVTNVCGFCGEVPFEQCDGIDNNCDGEVDEGVANRCGGCGPEPQELCNGIDDDCDGVVDDGVANACGGCGPLPLEICDGEDNDCDGETDEDTEDVCEDELSGSVCISDPGECARPCSANECPTGKICIDDYCITDPCVGVSCAIGYICDDGECLNLCDINEVDCEGDLVCVGGHCVEDVCSNTGCDEGYSCVENECQEDPCYEVSCGLGLICDEGDCIEDPCITVVCEDGERCAGGDCIDACEGIECGAEERCVDGFCVINSCAGVACPEGSECSEGNCVATGCIDVVCAVGQICQEGSCVTTRVGGPCGSGLSVCGDDLICFEGICRELSDPLVADLGDDQGDDGSVPPPPSGGPDEGCECRSAATARGPWVSLFLFGFVWLRRRKSA